MTSGSGKAESWRGLRDSQGGHEDPQPLGTPMPGIIPRMSPGCPHPSLAVAPTASGLPITPSIVMGCHHPPTGATLQCHPPVPPPVPGTLRPRWLLCDPPSSCHGHSVPALCHPMPVTGLCLWPHSLSPGKTVPGAAGKGQGRTDSLGAPAAAEGSWQAPVMGWEWQQRRGQQGTGAQGVPQAQMEMPGVPRAGERDGAGS